jgi:hypothetical protein
MITALDYSLSGKINQTFTGKPPGASRFVIYRLVNRGDRIKDNRLDGPEDI